MTDTHKTTAGDETLARITELARQALQSQARAGGFAITITPVEYTTLLEERER